MNITTLIVINGHQCEVLIPEVYDIHILKEDNCSDWEGWANGIKYFEQISKKPIYKQFTHLCLINASAIGPIYEDGIDRHWLDPFLDKMKVTNSVACSPCINVMPNSDAGGYGRKLVPILALIRIDKEIIRLLTTEQITNVCETSIFTAFPKKQNTILGFKTDKVDAALTGEYGLSRMLLKNNYNICSLLEGTDYIKVDLYNKNIKLLESTVFIKNVWRCSDTYASPPVLYNYCISFINNKLKYRNLFTNTCDIDYTLINKQEIGKMYDKYWTCDSITSNNKKWNTKKELYELFGYSEELIVFPTIKKNNTSCVIYAHYDKANIIKDYVLQSLKLLIALNYDVIFYTASDKINNIDECILPFKINYFKNIGAGTDWLIWLDGLNKLNNRYQWIMLINDSLLLGINGIDNMRDTINKMRNLDIDLWGHWDSYEINYHYVGVPIEFKYKLVNDLIIFLKAKLKTCKKKMDYVFNIETQLVVYLQKLNYKMTTVIKTKQYDELKYTCPTHNPLLLKTWINNIDTFAVKWKYIISYLEYKNIVSPYFKYLLRYLLTGDNVYKFEADGSVFISSSIYKSEDLFNKKL
jgi:hypothetical protein